MKSAEQYQLKVFVGSSYVSSEQKQIKVNNEEGIEIDNKYMAGRVVVRIRDLEQSNDTYSSAYFAGTNDRYSIQIFGTFHQELDGPDLVFGNDFDTPLNLPPGSNLAVRFVKWFDPGLEADIKAAKPWAYSPALVCMNEIHVAVLRREERVFTPKEVFDKDRDHHISEDTQLLTGKTMESKVRRRYLSQRPNLAEIKISPGYLYCFDFHNPFIDFSKRQLCLPGFKINAMKYWKGGVKSVCRFVY